MKKKPDKVKSEAAQLRLTTNASPADPSLGNIPSIPIEKNLHELRVHQIELEMQNEELRHAVALLEESRGLCFQTLDLAPVCYLMLAKHGLIFEANRACAKLLKTDREHLINRHFTGYIAPEDGERWQQFYRQAFQPGGSHSCEITLLRADGSQFHANLDCLPMKLEGALDTMYLRLSDISERKQSEQRLRIAANAFDAQVGILVTDANKIILRVNQAFTRITGYSADEAVGQKPSLLSSGQHDAEFYQAMRTSIANDGFWQGEVWNRRKNGEIYPIWLINTAITDDNKNITHYVGSFTDITLQKQTEKYLIDVRQHLEDQVEYTKAEMEKAIEESRETKSAINVLLKHQQMDITEAQHRLSFELGETVLPFMEKLKQSGLKKNQARLVNAIEANLLQLSKSYGSPANLPTLYKQLTPVEIRVATLIRQGLSTKTIASTLSLSPETISVHRKHIRKKLGLESKATNLRSYLLTLLD